jgi:putative PEP-CTERM system histidine kinase
MAFSVFLLLASAALAVILAVAMLVRSPRTLVNVVFVSGLLLLAGEAACSGLALAASTAERLTFWTTAQLLFLACLPGTWLLFSLIYSRGDSARSLRRWSPALLGVFAAPVLLWAACRPGLIRAVEAVGTSGAFFVSLGWAGLVLHGFLLFCSVLVLMNLEQTFVASVGTMRWRLKFMVLGLALLFGVRLYSSSQILLYRAGPSPLPVVEGLALMLACVLMAVALSRARLFEVEIYPSQTVLHGSLTAILAGVYLLTVGLLAKASVLFGDEASVPLRALFILVAVVGVGLLLLSDRIRQRLRLLVSRHFQRPLYDYRKVWSALTHRTTSVLDVTDFCRTVARLLSDTFGTLSVTVWLVDDQQHGLAFAASTLLAEAEARTLLEGCGPPGPWLRAIQSHPRPVDLDDDQEAWLADLRKWNPDFFHKGGNRVCLPLVAGGEVLGLIMLADRVSGLHFSLADLDLLQCIGDQVAAGLHNLRLSKQILRAKEMEAFQTVSTFFVHDLKNLAYTLSLMLQNMQEHFGDPSFREDAFKGLGRSVAHLNDLISRFSLLRQGLEIQPVETDLAKVVTAALNGVGDLPGVSLARQLVPLPQLKLDPGQFQKVVTNLVLNAKDAVGPGGHIQVQTGRRDGWAWVAVTDDGAGMSPDFIERSLFRPFKTTKKNGLGIGMFHSKLIVEAHHGKMEVESQPGHGTTFRVLLPLDKAA